MSSDSDSDSGSNNTEFSFGTRLGLVFIVESAFLSAISVSLLLTYIAYSTVRLRRTSSRRWSTGTHVHYYFVSLLISDLIQAIGGILNIKWIEDAAVVEGTQCQVQGIFKQLGDVGVALASLAIAMHTFSVLVLRWRPSPSPRIAILVIVGIWIFLALNIGISAATHKGEEYWGDTQYWCWISASYPVQRIVLEYLWLWITCFSTIILYVPIALVLKGILVVDGWRVRFIRRSNIIEAPMSATQDARDANGIAMQMLFYPAVYIITVLPTSVVRWRAFTGGSVPYPATVFSDTLFASSGLLNVLLFSVTRPSLVPRRNLSTLRKLFTFGSESQSEGGASPRQSNVRNDSDPSRLFAFNHAARGGGGFELGSPERALTFPGAGHLHMHPNDNDWEAALDTQTDYSEPWVFRPQPRSDKDHLSDSGSAGDFK